MIINIFLKITIRMYVIIPYLTPIGTIIQNFFWWGVIILQISQNLVNWYYNTHADFR